MKQILFTILILLGVISSIAQVPTRMYEKGQAFEKHPKFKVSQNNSPEKEMPVFDLAPLLAEDEAVKGLDFPFRFGKSLDVNLTLTDGKWVKTDSTEVWGLKITSPNAYSLNFIFSELYLPERAELYIFNDDGTMVYGPVTEKQNQHGKNYLTDIIQGKSATIQLSIPITSKEKPELIIQRVVHGYRNIFSNLAIGYGESGDCNADVACYFPAWEDEADGVVQILLSTGAELCSGSLLNNTAQDFRPFILTAFHCIDLDESGALSAGEITNAEDWLVRFRFRHTTCGGSTIANVISYDDTQFRAAWNTTDFALVELQDNIINDIYSVGQKVWLGWDRTGNTPSSGVYIHHPSGDVMKYAYDQSSLLETNYDGTTSGQNYWYSQIDVGTMEAGSSGSPVFDQQSRVVGQLRGGYPGCSSNKRFWHGCFHRSWTGNSTDATSLSHWLQPAGAPIATTLNSIRQPTPAYSGIGDVLCTNSNVSVIYPVPSYSIDHWNGSNVTFPNGNTGNPVLVSPGSQGPAWVQAVINTGAGLFTMAQKNFWVGPYSSSNYPITGPSSAPCRQYVYYSIPTLIGVSSINWVWPSGWTYVSGQNTTNLTLQTGTTGSGGIVGVQATNACGTGSYATKYTSVTGICGYSLSVSPNPAAGETTIELVSDSKETLAQGTEWELDIYDSMQSLKEKKTNLKTTQTKIYTTGWKDGVYVVRAKIGDEVITEKLVVKH